MTSLIVDSKGAPFPKGGARADGGNSPFSVSPGRSASAYPYVASDLSTQEMGGWNPFIRSPDAEINMFRDRMVARSRDLARNDGWANGGITRILDNTVGTHLRLSANPDYRALAVRFKNAGFDAVWADEFRKAAEALWRGYSENVGRYNDVSRQLTVGQQFRLAMRHKLIDGEALGVAYWMEDRVGYGGADYATALMLVDPDRLSNPWQMVDTKYMRNGVEIDDHGVPVAYHLRDAEQYDWYNAMESNTWSRIPREDGDGWRRVIHDYDRDRVGQHRGIGVFTPVLAHAKMLAKYYGIELQAATISATFGTYITSPYDPALVEEAIGGGDLPMYQKLRADWHDERPAMLNGARISTLAPGESINSVASTHPNGNFEGFTHEMHRMTAAALGISAEQITQDWSKTNYSSARAALLESWKTLTRRANEFKTNFASPVYTNWLGEAMDNGELPLPSGAPDFMAAMSAYSRCDWLGVARGWVDPVKEKQGAVLGMSAGISTLKKECAEQGLDYEEVIQQRAIEQAAFKEHGLTMPNWANNDQTATESAAPEEKEKA